MIAGEENYRKVNTILLAVASVTLFIEFSFPTPGFKLRPFDLILMVLVIQEIANTDLLKVRKHSIIYYFFFILFIVYLIVNCTINTDKSTLIKETTQFLEFGFFAALCHENLKDRENRSRFIKVFTFGIAIVAIGTALIHMAGGSFYDFKDFPANKYTFGLLSLVIFWAVIEKKIKRRRLYVAFFISLVLTILSGERKGWLALIMSISVYYVVTIKWKAALPLILKKKQVLRSALFTFVAIAGLGTIAVLAQGDNYVSKQMNAVFEIKDLSLDNYKEASTASNRERLFLIGMALTEFQKEPIIGIGIDNFVKHLGSIGVDSDSVNDVHNYYLKILVELGLIGFVLFSIFIISICYLIITALREIVGSSGELKEGSLLVMMIFIFGMIENLFLSGKALIIFYFMFPFGYFLAVRRQINLLKEKS